MDRSLVLQPPPGPIRTPKSVAEFIRSTNAEPGGFRGLKQRKSQPNATELGSDDAGEDAEPDVEMADASEADDSTKPKDIPAAREELMRNINMAQNTAKMTLEFLSLLLSKENPVQAVDTLSPELRSMVGIGTLGATLLDSPSTIVKNRVADHKLTAIGKRLLVVNKAADNARAAATRLQRDIALETKYWAEVMAVSEKGWSTFRLPQEPQTMAVKFGFSNAAPEFKAASIAPMRKAEDGSVRLEHGRMGGESKRLQVTISQGGEVVGKSSLPAPLTDDAPFEDHVKESRNTLFALELWHELNREGRALLGRGIQLDKSAVTYNIDSAKSVILQLVSLEQDGPSNTTTAGPEDEMAETISITLHLLLSNAHRQNEAKRIDQSIPGANRGHAPPYDLLLPVVMKFQHEQAVKRCTESLLAISRVLRSAGLNSSFTMTEPPVQVPSQEVPSKALAESLINPPEVEYDLTITPDSRVRITAKPHRLFGTRFAVYMLPSIRPGSPNPLSEWFPPDSLDANNNRYNDGMYDNTERLFRYLCGAIPRALTLHYIHIAHQLRSGGKVNGRNPTKWIIDSSGKSLTDDGTDNFGVKFDFDINDATGCPEINVTGRFVEGGKPVPRSWQWTIENEPPTGDLEEIVRMVLSNGPGS